jgi:hypothetical protein
MLGALLTSVPGPSAAQTTEVVGPMTAVMPSGWTRRATDPPSFFVAEMSAAGQEEFHVYFNSVVQPGAAQAAVHTAVWNQMLQREPRQKLRLSNGSLGRFTWSQMEVAAGQRSEVSRLYSTQAESTHVVVLVVATSTTMFGRHLATVESVLTNAKFRGVPDSAASPGRSGGASAAAGGAAAPSSSGVPWLPAQDIPIVDSQLHIQISSGGFSSNVLTDVILFFKNGVVVREGIITAPRSCYATIPAADLTTLPHNYGRWQENKATGEVLIKWQEGSPWTLKRQGDRLSLGGRMLLKFRPLDGVKLDGTFVHRSLAGTNIPLVLRRDGTFETSGLMEEMVCEPPDRRPTLSGSGTYEIRKWTLILRFTSGKVTLLPFSVLSEEDLRAINKFSLRSAYDFSRVR